MLKENFESSDRGAMRSCDTFEDKISWQNPFIVVLFELQCFGIFSESFTTNCFFYSDIVWPLNCFAGITEV
jgi:hypothetical protein